MGQGWAVTRRGGGMGALINPLVALVAAAGPEWGNARGPRDAPLAQEVSDSPVVLGGCVDKGSHQGSAQVCDQRMVLPFQRGCGREGRLQRAPQGSHQVRFLGSRGMASECGSGGDSGARESPEPMYRPPALRSPEGAMSGSAPRGWCPPPWVWLGS